MIETCVSSAFMAVSSTSLFMAASRNAVMFGRSRHLGGPFFETFDGSCQLSVGLEGAVCFDVCSSKLCPLCSLMHQCNQTPCKTHKLWH